MFTKVCPVHCIWPFIERTTKPGGEIFSSTSYVAVLRLLKYIVTTELKLKLPAPIGTHSLRRGCLQSMEKKGGRAVELLKLGMWDSKAINVYRDLKKSEENSVYELVDVQLDEDEDEEEVDEEWIGNDTMEKDEGGKDK